MTTPTVTTGAVSIHDERKVSIELTGGVPPMPVQHGSGQFQPTNLIVIYVKPYGEDQWMCLTAKVSGPRLKNSGAHSINTAEHRWYPESATIPEWAQEKVNQYMPTADMH